MRRLGVLIFLTGMASLLTAPVIAGSTEDYEQGRQAFHRDDLMGALFYLRRASNANHAPAKALLGYILDRAEENEEAFRLFTEAAMLGDPAAMYGLAVLYQGGEGVERDLEKAVHWYTQAADHGHEHAALVLGDAHIHGKLGVSRDRERGIELLRSAAGRGYVPARERLRLVEGSPQ